MVTWRNYCRIAGLIGTIGTAIIAVAVVTAMFAPLIAPYDPLAVDLSKQLMAPDWAHLFGTDQAGRDIFSRIVYGAQTSLIVAVLAVTVGISIGMPLGLLAGFYSGTVLEQIIMRCIDALASIPLIIWAIAVVGILGVQPIHLGFIELPNHVKLIMLIGLMYVPNVGRVIYPVAIAESKSDYVRARRGQGASNFAIAFGDVLPNCMSPLVVQATLLVAVGVIIEASVSFIGLGVQPPTPSWGGMLSEARAYLFSGEWWLFVFPGLSISITVIGFNLIGDALTDALDPRRRTANAFT